MPMALDVSTNLMNHHGFGRDSLNLLLLVAAGGGGGGGGGQGVVRGEFPVYC